MRTEVRDRVSCAAKWAGSQGHETFLEPRYERSHRPHLVASAAHGPGRGTSSRSALAAGSERDHSSATATTDSAANPPHVSEGEIE
jgi:hypothetical protein